jgi:hypothetical protein
MDPGKLVCRARICRLPNSPARTQARCKGVVGKHRGKESMATQDYSRIVGNRRPSGVCGASAVIVQDALDDEA